MHCIFVLCEPYTNLVILNIKTDSISVQYHRFIKKIWRYKLVLTIVYNIFACTKLRKINKFSISAPLALYYAARLAVSHYYITYNNHVHFTLKYFSYTMKMASVCGINIIRLSKDTFCASKIITRCLPY